ncbi:MAG TPA: hypothetical protein VF170_00055, partial [Planctomycetaceae bacterium]
QLELSLDDKVEVRAEQRGEPAAGGVGVRAYRGMVGRLTVRDPADADAGQFTWNRLARSA